MLLAADVGAKSDAVEKASGFQTEHEIVSGIVAWEVRCMEQCTDKNLWEVRHHSGDKHW